MAKKKVTSPKKAATRKSTKAKAVRKVASAKKAVKQKTEKAKAVKKVASPKKAVKQKSKKAKAVKRVESAKAASPFEEMEKFFDDYFSSRWIQPFQIGRSKFPRIHAPFKGKSPSVDIIDRDKNIIVKAKLPGVEKKDIDISVSHNTVTIKATTSREERKEKGDYYHREISQGSYARSLLLPAEVDESKTKAKFTNGILELSLEKTKKPKRQAIAIN